MKKARVFEACGFANHLRMLADAVEKDPKRFQQTMDALQLATGVAARPDDDDDDDDDDDGIDWGEVAFIGIMILTL
jgi:hypothetical protein